MSTRRRRSRAQPSKTKYAMIVVIVCLGAAIGWYAYSSTQPATSSATVSGSTSTSTNICASSASTASGTSTNNIVYTKISTSVGTIEAELFPNSAPKTVANFVSLAKSGFYDSLVWHRIVKGFVIQTGDPYTRNGGGNRSLWGTGGSSTKVPLEIDNSLHNCTGYLGMARSQDPNSGSSQFYINLVDNTQLDGSYTVFGKVISGMDVVNKIGSAPVNSASQPTDNVFVTGVTIQQTP